MNNYDNSLMLAILLHVVIIFFFKRTIISSNICDTSKYTILGFFDLDNKT